MRRYFSQVLFLINFNTSVSISQDGIIKFVNTENSEYLIMIKSRTTILATLAATFCGFAAQGVNFVPGDQSAAYVAKAYQMGSSDNKWGFTQWNSNDLSTKTMTKNVSSDLDQVGAAEYVDGKYYAFTYAFDMLMGTGLELSQFVVYDAADNYRTITSRNLYSGNRVIDMTYDYAHNTMYALVELSRADNGVGKTALHVVDLATGTTTLVGLPGDIRALDGYGRDVEEHLMSIASAPSDGTLYAMGEYRRLYTLNRMTGEATPVGERNRVALTNDLQTMAFTPDGRLFQAHMHPDYEYWMEVNPTDGSLYNPETGMPITIGEGFTNNGARMAGDPQITGLYFEGKTYNSTAIGKVEGLTLSIVDGQPNSVLLTWESAPAGATSVNVYRMGTAEPVASIAAPETEWTDTNAPNGYVSYYVVALDANGEGFPTWATIKAGYDALEAVADLTATLDGDEVTVTWSAPTLTQEGGYADYNAITYNVVRWFGSQSEVLATGIEDTEYYDELTENGTYTYEVIPFCGGVEGASAMSNAVKKESTLSVPYSTGFGDEDGGTLWEALNNTPNAGYGWSIITGYAYQQLDGKFAQFKTYGTSSLPADDWFFSPAIMMPSGTYKLVFWANGSSYDNHTFKIYVGADSTAPADFTQVIYQVENELIYDAADTNNHYIEIEVPFTVAESGAHRIAFQGIGASTYATLKIDNLSITPDGEVGVSTTGAGGGLFYNRECGEAVCPGATLIEAFDASGRILGVANEARLEVSAEGILILRATTPEGVETLKVVL